MYVATKEPFLYIIADQSHQMQYLSSIPHQKTSN